jgi:hypothetical protein
VEGHHRVDEAGARQQARWRGREQEEAAEAEERGDDQRPARGHIPGRMAAVQPDQQGRGDEEMQGGVEVTGDHREYGHALQPVVEPQLGVEMQPPFGVQQTSPGP